MSKRFLIILVAIAVIFIGIIVATKKDKATDNGGGNATAEPTKHVVGKEDSTVTLIEYGDFQCPSCAAYYPVIEQVKQKYGDQLAFQFRHFPLTQIHPNAMAAHRASEAAGKQDKFWQMYSLLYERQQEWSSSSNAAQIFEDYATKLALNIDKYKQDIASSEASGAINADLAAGKEIKVSGTPTFVLNGKKLDNPEPTLDAFSKLIDEAIKN